MRHNIEWGASTAATAASARALRRRWGAASFGAAVLLAALCGTASGQQVGEPPRPGRPMDVNQPRPVGDVPPEKKEGEQAAGQPAAPGQPPAATPADVPQDQAIDMSAPNALDGGTFKVTRFAFEWAVEHPQHEGLLEKIGNQPLTLGVTPEGFVSPAVLVRAGDRTATLTDDEGAPKLRPIPTTTVKLGDVFEGDGAVFHLSALREVTNAVVRALNSQGLIAVVVETHPEDVDEKGQDLRAGSRGEIRLRVHTYSVGMVRSIASGDRLKNSIDKVDAVVARTKEGEPIYDPVHKRIREQSPIRGPQGEGPGDLINGRELDDYVFRLNRHPGRRVDVSLAPGENEDEAVLDFLINESKPWSVYAQLSNTGTESTSEWRQRFGFIHNQLSKHDDILRVDFITGGFDDASNTFNASYEWPLKSDHIRARVYGLFSDFNASDVGQSGDEFDGTTWAGGAEVTSLLHQHREIFLDFAAGIRYQQIEINNAIGTSGRDDFLIPYLGLLLTRATDSAYSAASVFVEYNPGWTVDEATIDDLGRLEASDEWWVIKFNAEHSFYLDTLFDWKGMLGPSLEDPSKMVRTPTLAHEISLSLRGQFVPGDERLIPNEEEVAGGMFSVRGYPESVVAGDNVVIASAEYRFHLPRIFPASDPGKIGDKRMGSEGSRFRWAPQGPLGRPDWDLVFTLFTDVARATNNNKQAGEFDETLWSVGAGVELQVSRNLNMRLDWGVALEETEGDGSDGSGVEQGDNRLHFSATLLY